MTAPDMPLAEQRQVLRGQMWLQRQRIAHSLVPAERAVFPRSVTMRLVMQHPQMLAQLALGLLRLWRWRRQIRSPGHGREDQKIRQSRGSVG